MNPTQPNIPSWNYFDYVPLISNVSGTVRIGVGTIEAVVGVVTGPTIELVGRLCGRSKPFLFIDGIANVIRGSVAEAPVIGNIALYIYDHSSSKSTFQRDMGIYWG